MYGFVCVRVHVRVHVCMREGLLKITSHLVNEYNPLLSQCRRGQRG